VFTNSEFYDVVDKMAICMLLVYITYPEVSNMSSMPYSSYQYCSVRKHPWAAHLACSPNKRGGGDSFKCFRIHL